MIRALARAVRRRWKIGSALSLTTLLAGLMTLPGAPATYVARARVALRETPFPVAPSEVPLAPAPWPRGKSLDFLRSDAVLERALKTGLSPTFPIGWPADLAASTARLRSRLEARREKDSDVLVLSCASTRSGEAMEIVNAVARAFKDAASERRLEEVRQALGLIDQALRERERAHADLAAALGPSAPGRVPDPEEQRLRERVSELEHAQAAARLEAESLSTQVEQLTRRIERQEIGPARAVNTSESDRLAREIEITRRDLADLRASLPPDAPPLARLAGRVEELEKQKTQAMNREVLEARFAPLRDLIEQVRQASARREEMLRSIAAREPPLAEARRALEQRLQSRLPPPPGADPQARRDLEARLLASADSRKGLESLRARVAKEQALAPQIVERLDLARGASFSGSPLPLLLLVALALGLAAALALEALSATLRTEYDVRRYVNLPLLGIVPRARAPEDRLLLAGDPRAPLAEPFNTAVALLESRAKAESWKSFAMVSPSPGEGKSTAACNLGIALARAGSRVLVVDADLRRASLHRLLSVPNEVGLSSYLQGAADTVDAAIARTAVENLSLLPSGPLLDDPGPYLRSERLKAMVADLHERYDLVLLDLPPVLSAADALWVAPLCDGTILVLAAAESRKDDATSAKRLLRSARAKLAGCILNKSTVQGRGYYYYSATAPADAGA